MSLKITWIGGWAIPASAIKQCAQTFFPLHEHRVVSPCRDWRQSLPEHTDVFVGYSLGAFLMLLHPEYLNPTAKKILLAPFVDYKKEAGKGGRISVTQLRYLIKMLRADALGAVNRFYNDAQLSYQVNELPYSVEDLIWGIQLLIDGSVNTPLNEDCFAYIGEDDPLLDSTLIARYFKHIKSVARCGHRLEDIIKTVNL